MAGPESTGMQVQNKVLVQPSATANAGEISI